MNKKEKLILLQKLISENEIDTQEELTEKLNEQGADVSQATVSRYLNELNVIKVEGVSKKFRYKKCAETTEIPQRIIDLFKQVCLSIVSVNNFIIVKTLSGNANSAGMSIDAMHFSQVLGTIAGDDTLLIITKNNAEAETIVKTLKSL